MSAVAWRRGVAWTQWGMTYSGCVGGSFIVKSRTHQGRDEIPALVPAFFQFKLLLHRDVDAIPDVF